MVNSTEHFDWAPAAECLLLAAGGYEYALFQVPRHRNIRASGLMIL